jgi:tetratricopeptide (TPR) repeat protein
LLHFCAEVIEPDPMIYFILASGLPPSTLQNRSSSMNSERSVSQCLSIPFLTLIAIAIQISPPGAILLAQAAPTSTSTITVDVPQSSIGDRQSLLEQKGVDLLLKREPEGAVEKFNEMLQSDPSDILALNNRANAYVQLGDIQKALADFDRAISLDNRKNFLFFNRGIAHARTNQLNEAIADYTAALYLNPQDTRALTNRGNLYIKTANLRAALADYDAALKIDPKLAKATYDRAQARRQAGDPKGALADYRMASKLLREEGFDVEAEAAAKLVATLQEELKVGQLP